jgi:chaperonin GroEL (HSP60 family)
MLVRGTKDRERCGRCTQAIDCLGHLVQAGIIDPVKVSYSAVRNAASVAGSILTRQTLIAKKPDYFDPTDCPYRKPYPS